MSKPSEKVKVNVSLRPDGDGVVPEFVIGKDHLVKAGWTDDPTEGKAILAPDGSEILNPVPVAPPIGYVAEPSMMDMIDKRIRAHSAMLAAAMEIDSEEEMNDFDIEDDFDPMSVYEFAAMPDDFPGRDPAQPPPPPDPAAKPPEILPPEEPIPKDDNKS